MLCQNCNKNPANTFISRTIGGKTTELHLCAECAAATALSKMSLLGFDFAAPTAAAPKKNACPKCGATLRYISASGMLGCPGCYDYFEKELTPAIVRAHGNVTHKTDSAQKPADAQKSGKPAASPPDPAQTLSQKQAQLRAAIKAEEFERAAALRDEIRALRGEHDEKTKS